MDIAYILGAEGPDDYAELRYSLRSLKFLPHDTVWIAGVEPPSWVRNVEWIPVEQLPLDRKAPGNRWWINRKLNMRTNLLATADHPDVSETFIHMNDDYMFVTPLEALPPMPHLGLIRKTVRGRIEDRKGPYPDLYWWFRERGIDPLRIPEHVPFTADKTRLADWMRQVWHITGFPVHSLYVNLAGTPTVKGEDFILKRPHHHDGWPDSYWAVSTGSQAWNEWPVGDRLRALLSEPGRYER